MSNKQQQQVGGSRPTKRIVDPPNISQPNQREARVFEDRRPSHASPAGADAVPLGSLGIAGITGAGGPNGFGFHQGLFLCSLPRFPVRISHGCWEPESSTLDLSRPDLSWCG